MLGTLERSLGTHYSKASIKVALVFCKLSQGWNFWKLLPVSDFSITILSCLCDPMFNFVNVPVS